MLENLQWLLAIGLGQVVTCAPFAFTPHIEVLNSWKSLEICPAIFQAWKSLQNGDKIWKNGKRVSSLFSKLHSNCFIIFFVFRFWQILFFCCILKVSIDELFDNLESGKRYCFGKKSGKSLEFWIQESVRTLNLIIYTSLAVFGDFSLFLNQKVRKMMMMRRKKMKGKKRMNQVLIICKKKIWRYRFNLITDLKVNLG